MKKHIYTLLFLMLILAGCSSQSESSAFEYASMSKELSAPSSALRSESDMQPMMDEAPASEPESKPAASGAQNTERKRIYNGNAEIVVDKPEEIRKNLEQLALDSGGYVESSYSGFVALRVPVQSFTTIFDTILTMGKVRSKQISTWDVTDQFADTSQRLQTAEKTRERLYELLKKTSDAGERARILKEIGRLSEEIEAIRQQLVLMENRIAFSRITVGIIPRLEDDTVSRDIPFGWIAALSPLNPVSERLKAKITLNPGDEFAVFSKEDLFLAEDSEGTTLSVSTVDNTPRGDSEFWQKALLFHLSDYYENAEPLVLHLGSKEFPGVKFTSKDRTPFQYIVAVLSDDRDLQVVEIFSPRSDRDLTPLFKALERGEIK